jgi:hypothetical protein
MILNITTGESGTDLGSGSEPPPQSGKVNIGHLKMSSAEDRANLRRGGHVLPRALLAGLLFLIALTPGPLHAQADAAKAPLPSNRYLLVVETSRSMQRRADGVLQTVRDLLRSGLGGQLRRGDTLGIWTYNESLQAGRFPLQTWSPAMQNDITLRMLAFLRGQKYDKQAGFDKVLPALSGVVKASPRITVILISSGDEKIHGTPFDDRINAFCQKWHDAQQKARMPFVTVFRGQDGQIADFSLNTPPWPVQMPLRPQEAQSADTVQSKLPDAARTAPPPTLPPLIISGKKTQPEAAPTPKPEPSGVNAQAPVPALEATNGSNSLTPNPPTPTAQQAQIAKTESAPPLPDKASADLPPTPPPATKPVPGPKSEVTQGPETKVAAPVPAKTEATSVVPPPTFEPIPAPLEPPKTTSASEPKPALAPAPGSAVPATQEVSPGPSASVTDAASAPLRASSVPVVPTQTATAVPAETLVSHASLWIAGLVLAGVAISFVFLLRRRAHAAHGVSLITQSFERKNKP